LSVNWQFWSNIRALPAAYFFSFGQLLFKVTFFVLAVIVSPQRCQYKESHYQLFTGLQTFTQAVVLWNTKNNSRSVSMQKRLGRCCRGKGQQDPVKRRHIYTRICGAISQMTATSLVTAVRISNLVFP